jgi:hypothetical protein
MPDEFRMVQQNYTANESSTLVYYHRSYKTIVYQTKYLQLLDALSFVGGMFEVMLCIFFFMAVFGRVFFEIKFARKYFKEEVLKTFSIWDLLKQMLYKMLVVFGCPPDWKDN